MFHRDDDEGDYTCETLAENIATLSMQLYS